MQTYFWGVYHWYGRTPPPPLSSPPRRYTKNDFVTSYVYRRKIMFLVSSAAQVRRSEGKILIDWILIFFFLFSSLIFSNVPSFVIKSRLPVSHGACVHLRRNPWLILIKMTAYHKCSGPRKWSKSLRYKPCRNSTPRRLSDNPTSTSRENFTSRANGSKSSLNPFCSIEEELCNEPVGSACGDLKSSWIFSVAQWCSWASRIISKD